MNIYTNPTRKRGSATAGVESTARVRIDLKSQVNSASPSLARRVRVGRVASVSRLSAAATEFILALRDCPAESRKSYTDEPPCSSFRSDRMSHPSDKTPAGSGSQSGRPSPLDGDLSGRQLGDYRLLRRLGRGGMAEVYLAEQLSLKR